MSSPFSVVAIIAAYNEADIIGPVVADLIEQGIDVYVLDDGSTDGTVAAVEPFVGRGVLAIERLAARGDAGDRFEWERILRRKTELAAELDASWFIHHDADEYRESPWVQLSLKDAIRHVDGLGFNAIDFMGYEFWPTDRRFRPGSDVRDALTLCSELAPYDRLQIRCWKKTAALDLASSGGHEAKFPGRRVFPLRFILRHYPIRDQEHGERKVFRERRPRFLDRERDRGWHVQYDSLREGTSFVRDPSELSPFDRDAVRVALALRHRGAEELEESLEAGRRLTEAAQAEIARLAAEVARKDVELADKDTIVAGLRQLEDVHASTRAALEAQTADIERWRASVDGLTRELEQLRRSLSWRWTAPARAAYRILMRGRT